MRDRFQIRRVSQNNIFADFPRESIMKITVETDWSPFSFENFHRHVRWGEAAKNAFDLPRHAHYDFHLIKSSPFNVPLILLNR